jgi:hypothetical protein
MGLFFNKAREQNPCDAFSLANAIELVSDFGGVWHHGSSAHSTGVAEILAGAASQDHPKI